MIGVAAIVWGSLVALEILFWIHPPATSWQGLKRRLYRRPGLFFALPAEYLVRLATVAVILTATGAWGKHVTSSSLVGATLGIALASVAAGLVLGTIMVASFLAQQRTSWRQWISGNMRKPGHAAYILFWVAGVEEFLFRAVLITLLAPQTGAWAIPISSAANLVWHIPVWLDYAAKAKGQEMQVTRMLLMGAVTSLLLGAIYYVTGSLFGPIIAHFAGDTYVLVADSPPASRDPH